MGCVLTFLLAPFHQEDSREALVMQLESEEMCFSCFWRCIRSPKTILRNTFITPKSEKNHFLKCMQGIDAVSNLRIFLVYLAIKK